MPELKKTSNYGKGRAAHYHVVYLRDKDGITSIDKNHSHQIIWQEVTIPQMQPDETGMPTLIQVPTGEGNLVVQPAQDGHTHELTDLEIKPEKEDKEDKEKTVEDVIKIFKYIKGIEEDSRKKSHESCEFARGEQWDKQLKKKLNNEDRAALTFNEIEASIDVLCGYQRQNRTEFKAYPIEDGDSRAADILNVLVKSIEMQNEFSFTDSMVFKDLTIPGRGFFHAYIDYDSGNMNGEIKIDQFAWDDVYLGQHEKLDASDCEALIKSKWYSMQKLKQEFPDKAEDVDREVELIDEFIDKPHTQYSEGQYDKSKNVLPHTDPDLVDTIKKEFRVLELWRKQFKRVPVITDLNELYFNGSDLKASDVSAFETIQDLKVVKKRVVSMRITKIASHVLLDDNYMDDEDFDIFPAYAKKEGDNWWGKVEAAKDPQREENKRISQTSDILNKVASYVRYYDDSTFTTPKDRKDFEEKSTTPGALLKIANIQQPPHLVEGIKFPNELAMYSEIMTNKRRNIMNINPELLGANIKTESGVAQIEKKKQALIGNEFIFDNLRFTKKRLYKYVIKLIQKVFTPERILRIIENQNNMKPIKIGGQPLFPKMPQPQMEQGGMANPMQDPNQMAMMQQQMMEQRRQEILEILRNTDLTKFDIAIDESPESPTKRQANFAEWQRAAAQGYPTPPTMLYELSDLPDKERWIEEVKTMLQQQQEMEQRKMDNEIKKTLIAKQEPQMAGSGR